MIKVYDIADFLTPQSIRGEFMLEKFEKLNRPKNLEWPHKHSFYEIQWLTGGKAINVIDYHQITIQPQSLFFISPGQLHLMTKTAKSAEITGYSLTFTEEFLLMYTPNKNALMELEFLDNSYSQPSLKLTKKNISEIDPIFQLIIREVKLEQKSESIIGHLLFALLSNIQRLLATQHANSVDVAVVVKYKQFKKLIEGNYKNESKIQFYADKLFLTPHRVNEICKKITGRAAGEIIRDRIHLETKRLLLHSDRSIGEISEDLGFTDFSYFSRQFGKKEGITPAAYRKNMTGKYKY